MKLLHLIDTTRSELIVEGKLVVSGTQDSMVTFTSMDSVPNPGDWYGIRFMGSADDSSIIEYAVIENGCVGITCDGASPKIRNNLIRNNDELVVRKETISYQVVDTLTGKVRDTIEEVYVVEKEGAEVYSSQIKECSKELKEEESEGMAG